MDFKRILRENFIDELNRLYEDEKSWWHKIASDDEAFIYIRKNRVHVLVNGGLLMQIDFVREKLSCKVHEDFLSLRNPDNAYVKLEEDSIAPIQRVKGLKDLSKHYLKVKRRIKIFTGKEKQVVQNLGLKINDIIDMEIGLEGDKKEGALRKGAQRVDMAGITDKGSLVFFELKLFDNSEIRSKAAPKVVGQLKKYEKLLEKFQGEILDGYEKQIKTYQKLKGRFFKSRLRRFEKLKLYPRVRLIITGFDGSQKKFLLPTIIEGIQNGMDWDEKTPDLIVTGNHKNLNKVRLFKKI
jgi:hypothetical protein